MISMRLYSLLYLPWIDIRHPDGFKHKRQIFLAITIEDSLDETPDVLFIICARILRRTPGGYGAIACDRATDIWHVDVCRSHNVGGRVE